MQRQPSAPPPPPSPVEQPAGGGALGMNRWNNCLAQAGGGVVFVAQLMVPGPPDVTGMDPTWGRRTGRSGEAKEFGALQGGREMVLPSPWRPSKQSHWKGALLAVGDLPWLCPLFLLLPSDALENVEPFFFHTAFVEFHTAASNLQKLKPVAFSHGFLLLLKITVFSAIK